MVDFDESVSVQAMQRAEYLSDLTITLRDPIINVFLGMWQDVYKNDKVIRVKWLQMFQLSLKSVTTMDDETLAKHFCQKKRALSILFNVIMLTAYVYHDRAKLQHLIKDKPLLYKFVKDVLVHVARELWAKPYLMFNITHKKNEIAASREIVEKIVTQGIKHMVRSYSDDFVIEERERAERCTSLLTPVESMSEIEQYNDDPILEPPPIHVQDEPSYDENDDEDEEQNALDAIRSSAASSPVYTPRHSKEMALVPFSQAYVIAATHKALPAPQSATFDTMSIKSIDILSKHEQKRSPPPSSSQAHKEVTESDSDDDEAADTFNYIPIKREFDRSSLRSLSSTSSVPKKAIEVDGESSDQPSSSDSDIEIKEKRIKSNKEVVVAAPPVVISTSLKKKKKVVSSLDKYRKYVPTKVVKTKKQTFF